MSCKGGNSLPRRGATGPTGPTGPTGAFGTGPTGAPGTPGSDAAGYLKWSGIIAPTIPNVYLADTGDASVTVGGVDYPVNATSGRPAYPFGRSASIVDFFINVTTVLNVGQQVVVTLVVSSTVVFTATYTGTGAVGGIQAAVPIGDPRIDVTDTIDVQVAKIGTFTQNVALSAVATFGG